MHSREGKNTCRFRLQEGEKQELKTAVFVGRALAGLLCVQFACCCTFCLKTLQVRATQFVCVLSVCLCVCVSMCLCVFVPDERGQCNRVVY